MQLLGMRGHDGAVLAVAQAFESALEPATGAEPRALAHLADANEVQ
jgi:Asp-tRNA(Asn)/Glu-tRNA(Gln) amidotransferase A subunit family amidase